MAVILRIPAFSIMTRAGSTDVEHPSGNGGDADDIHAALLGIGAADRRTAQGHRRPTTSRTLASATSPRFSKP